MKMTAGGFAIIRLNFGRLSQGLANRRKDEIEVFLK